MSKTVAKKTKKTGFSYEKSKYRIKYLNRFKNLKKLIDFS
ncbi:hypothetical protein HMPREF9421_1354 [Streptococcus australis ATCC 700641]|uniref:Uncharacterized protein n=1 Tax=Streptococcus australis ATCC 700641 TaxID=888833 RepID=E7SAY7_9STRE|nr:hypothetical protein HMPREF9421_1354 [Streptococcus australis ATCC 700641]